MISHTRRKGVLTAVFVLATALGVAADPGSALEDTRSLPNERVLSQPATNWILARAFCVPKKTAPQGEGYTALIEGLNQRLYIGTHANAENSWLVEFDPATGRMKIVVDVHQAIGTNATGFAAQAKIHTRCGVGASGKIYFATKQGYPAKDEQRTDYPGGYPMVYDPAAGTTKVYPIPVPHQGLISITPDESRGLAYLSTCSDERPIDSTHFVVLNLQTGTYRDLMDCRHMYANIVVDHRGRAYHPVLGGDIARYDPETGQLVRLKQMIDREPPAADSLLADPRSHPIKWDISPDRRTLYAAPMSGNTLYAYDLTADGDALPGRSLGPLLAGADKVDCRALCVGPTGTIWCAPTVSTPAGEVGRRLHLVRYRPGQDQAPVDLGQVYVANSDFTEFTDPAGQPLPYHAGFPKLASGKTVTRYVVMGVGESRDGNVYLLTLHPYTVLQVRPADLD